MLINRVSRQLLGAPELLPALSELRAGNDATVAVSQSARTLVLASVWAQDPRPCLFVVSGEEAAERAAHALEAWLGKDVVLRYPERRDLPWKSDAPDDAVIGARTEAIGRLATGDACVVVASARSLLRRVPPVGSGYWASSTFAVGDEVPFEDALIDKAYGDINYSTIARISRELRPGMIWVTSGATEIGRLDFIKRTGRELAGSDEDNKTDYSAQGQSVLMGWYRQFVDSRFSLRQILVEHQHFNDAEKREYLKKVLLRCPEEDAIPIINYNDAVCYEENRKMEIRALMNEKKRAVECVDNDETASQIACLVNAKRLLILTSVNGIYTDISDENSLVREINGKNTEELLKNIEEYRKFCHGASRKGANGAGAKLEYIKAPVEKGTEVIIANSKFSIRDILEGNVPATRIRVR